MMRNASRVFTHDTTDSSDEEDASAEDIDEDEWYINGILEESESQYLIDWFGNWSPTWEPKENASELAVQVWEEKKKKKGQFALERSELSTEPLSTQSHIASSGGRRAETPDQASALQALPDSPLFVPIYTESEPQTQSTNKSSQLSLGGQGSVRPCSDTKPSFRNINRNVFEFCPRSPIPLEYLLPGEPPEPLDSALHPANSTSAPSIQANSNVDSVAVLSENIVVPAPRVTAISQPSAQSEIPETPTVPLNHSQSQVLRVHTLGASDPQQIASSAAFPSSSLPPRTLLPERPPLTGSLSPASNNTSLVYPVVGNTASVPGLASGDNAQLLTGRSAPTPTAQTPPDSISFPSSTLPSRISRLNRTADPGNPTGFQLTAEHSSFVPESSAVNISQLLVSQVPAATAAMDDQTQKKEGLSLGEALEKYSHLEGSTPREKIMNAYARLRDKSTTVEPLQNEPSATPSSVGDIEPSAPLSIPETVAPLSVRVDGDASHQTEPPKEPAPETPSEEPEPETSEVQTIQPSALTIGHDEHVSPGSLRLGPSEFAVPLPMDSRVKDDYERILLDESQAVYALISDKRFQEASDVEQKTTLSSAEHVLERLSNAATHPDINVAEHMKNTDANLQHQAKWAEYSSAKFLLLSYLIKASGDHDMHLVIMVRGEKTQEVVERYFEGKGFEYSRPRADMGSGTNVEVSMVRGSLSFGIQAAQGDGIMGTYKPPAAVIALDSSLDIKRPSVEHMRTTFARNGHLLPVVRPVIANSSEHVELCFPGSSTPERLALILRYSDGLRDIVGDLQDDALGVQEDANEIMTCLLSDNFGAHWTLPPVEPLREVDLSEPYHFGGFVKLSLEADKTATPGAQKRVFAPDTCEAASKRPRMEESQDISQLTESSKAATQTLESDVLALEKHLLEMTSAHAAELQKLRSELADTQSRFQEREKILESLQHRYETRTGDLHKVRQERDHLLETKTTSEQRIEKQKDDIAKLKDERTQLRHELEQAREALKTGGGDLAELEKAREDIRRLTKENASLERKAEYEHKQAEYTREQYQNASNAAAQSATELRQLQEENEELKRKVAGEASRLRELNIKSDENRHLARISELESLLSSREDLLHKKEDELREIRRNRPSTRSTSTAPRSPKLTAGNSRPTSPGINNGSSFPGRGSALRFSSEMSF
ncbi:uncharacterized protein BJX67DRAFT_364079 [Aspergillus lucknowensis]|uniref:Class II histone deacetylase complex subunits 2 and 3-domain-containing protein n=1 Tax=Aspergillus lucknowensis TaxID=176173 RepID=A0ABR4LGV6_9EURO